MAMVLPPKENMLMLVVLCIVSGQVIPAVAFAQVPSAASTTIDDAQTGELTSSSGVEYSIGFYPSNRTIIVEATNPNEHNANYSGFVVSVDEYELYNYEVNFSAGEYNYWKLNLSSGIDVLETEHTVTLSTYGDYMEFNFTDKINSSSSGPVPTPYISEVILTNGTIDSEPSAVAKVTVVNPSIHPYPLKLMVHTQDTDGSFYGASVPPGDNRTITVELLDERGSQIAGEARLYAGNLSRGDGAMDQVGFVGRVGENTSIWNETYEPIKGPWRNNGYEYHNESLADDSSWAEEVSRGYHVFGVPAVYVLTGLIALFAVFRWRR